MRIFGRTLTLAVAAVSALAVLPAAAQAVPARVAGASKASCTYGEINGSGNLDSMPTSHRPGQNLVTYTTVHNAQSAALTGTFFDYEMAAPSNRKGAAPTVWWKFNGGRWHHMPMTWYPAVPKGSDAVWEGGDASIGNLPGHATRTLEVTVDYPAGAKAGPYDGNLWLGAKTCGRQVLGGISLSTVYMPS